MSDSEDRVEQSGVLAETTLDVPDHVSMFASVWVKVEVDEDEDDDDDDEEFEPETSTQEKKSSKVRKRRKPLKVHKTLKCPSCDYTTIYKNCLNIHMLGHTSIKPFSCELCTYVTRYPTSLTRHVITQHQYKNSEEEKKLPLHRCDQCAYTSYYKWNLNAHRRKHKLEKDFKCELCSYTTAYRHNFMKHNKVHHKTESLYKCDKCPFVTRFEGHITRHLAKIHNEVSEKASRCDLCDFSTKVMWRLNIHKQRSRQTEPLKCIYCDFETFYMCESKKHKQEHYNEICVKKNEQYGYQPHDSSEHPPPRQEYNNTNVQSTAHLEPEALNQTTHEKNNHYITDPASEIDWNNIQVTESSDKDKPFQCMACTYTARFKASVQRHYQRRHTGTQVRPYKCLNCDFSTKTKDQISLHNKRSASEIQMFCRSCDFTTYFKCQFVMHQKCHYEHKCTACDYACKSKYDISKHYSTVHLGNGVKCRFCDYKTSRVESLQCHETIHTGDKPFKCSYCEYTSIRKSLLVNHIKRYHGDVYNKTEPVVIDDSKIAALKISATDLQEQIKEFIEHQTAAGVNTTHSS